jgi:hypothetical protein
MTLGLVLVMACVMGAGLVVVGVLRLGALAPAWKNAGIELAADNILVWMNINRGLPAEEQILAMRGYIEDVRRRAANGEL